MTITAKKPGAKVIDQIKASKKAKPTASRKQTPFKEIAYPGATMIEHQDYKGLLTPHHYASGHPLWWFEDLKGQMIYAASQDGFSGLILVADAKHAKKLEQAQMKGYYFCTIGSLGEKICQAQGRKEPAPLENITLTDEELKTMFNECQRIGMNLQDLDISNPFELEEKEYSIYHALAKEKLNEFSKIWNTIVQTDLPHAELLTAYNQLPQYENVEAIQKALLDETKGYPAQAVEAINSYLQVTHNDSVLSRVSDLVYPGGIRSEAEELEYLIQELKTFLFDPAISAAFFSKTNGITYSETKSQLDRLEIFFAALTDGIPEAELTKLAITNYPTDLSYGFLKNQIRYYNKKAAVEQYNRSN